MEAAVGLVGVVIGVALASRFEWRRDRVDRALRGRVAALVLGSELGSVVADVDFFLDRGQLPQLRRDEDLSGAWNEHRTAFAYVSDPDDFLKVSLAFSGLGEIYSVMQAGHERTPTIDVHHQREHLWEALEKIYEYAPSRPPIRSSSDPP